MPETSGFCRGPFANKLKQPFLARRIKSEFEKAVELDPTSIDGRHGLIQFYSQAPGVMGGSMDKAREQAREIGKLNAMRGHVELGTLLETKDKDLAGAEYEFAAAITAAPDSSYGFSSLATFYRRQKRFDEAVATWDRLLKARPDALKAHLNIAFNLVLSVTTEPRNHGTNHGTTEPRNYGTTELRNHGTTEPRNHGTALRRRCAQIRPLTRATQMGVDLHSRELLPDSLKMNDLGRAIASRGRLLAHNSGSLLDRLSKSSARICARRARSAPRICAHLRRSVSRCCSSAPQRRPRRHLASRRETSKSNRLTAAVARREHGGTRRETRKTDCSATAVATA